MQKVQRQVPVPQVVEVERKVEVPITREVEVPMVETVERVVEVPQLQVAERVVEIPQLQQGPGKNLIEMIPTQGDRRVAPPEIVPVQEVGPDLPAEQLERVLAPPMQMQQQVLPTQVVAAPQMFAPQTTTTMVAPNMGTTIAQMPATSIVAPVATAAPLMGTQSVIPQSAIGTQSIIPQTVGSAMIAPGTQYLVQ